MRDLNFFSKYHVAPAKTNPMRLGVVVGGIVAAAAVFLISVFFLMSNMNLQKQISEAEGLLKSREVTEQLESVSETEQKIATVKNDQVLFDNLEGDFRRIHRVNKAFMDFLNNRVTLNLVFDSIQINYDSVMIEGSSRERLSIAKFEEELRSTKKFNHIIVSTIENKDDGGAANVSADDPLKDIYTFKIEIVTKDVDFDE